MVVGELEPELVFDLVELRAGQARVDRAHRSQSQATHGLLTEPLAVVFDLVNRRCHEAGLYLAPYAGSIRFRARRRDRVTP
ncbi:hypothetical protein GCM10009679_74020 [Saccharothrix algeriensis]|uniref:Uncharacterized protein n=1 Tax=Catellatospora bangladeshensis TaxID=310355 RepID=A0A8J3NMK2_9ACTN|nr:hypothetical protein Cba03nite_76260 [Catellatospora bangladeshensis]